MSIPRPKWKLKKAARTEYFSQVKDSAESLLTCGKFYGYCEGNAVLVVASRCQTETLQSLGFGLSSNSTIDEELDNVNERIIQLSLEEAFFLVSEVKVLEISKRDEVLDTAAIYKSFCTTSSLFQSHFAAYAHLRRKGWFVRPGLQYGSHFTVYRHHPSIVHSNFAAVVISKEDDSILQTWSDLHAITRLAGTVSKNLLMLWVSRQPVTAEEGPECESCRYSVEELIVRRWLPEANRDVKQARQP